MQHIHFSHFDSNYFLFNFKRTIFKKGSGKRHHHFGCTLQFMSRFSGKKNDKDEKKLEKFQQNSATVCDYKRSEETMH